MCVCVCVVNIREYRELCVSRTRTYHELVLDLKVHAHGDRKLLELLDGLVGSQKVLQRADDQLALVAADLDGF